MIQVTLTLSSTTSKSLVQPRGYLTVAAAVWDHSGLENITLNVYSQRDVLNGLEHRELVAERGP